MPTTATKASVPRRHHYVPRFYLERFADQRGRLRAFNRQSGESITTSAKSVAVERDFYKIPDGVGIPVETLEELFSMAESDAAAAMRKVVAEGRVGVAERYVLAPYIALQTLRTRRSRNTRREMFEWVETLQAQIRLRERLSSGEFERESDRASAEELLGQLEAGEIRIGLDDEAFVGMSLLGLEEVSLELLEGWNWLVVMLTGPKFVTSDHPVCLLGEPEPGSPGTNVGVGNALEIWLPVDPRHALVLSRDHALVSPLIDLSNGHVRCINLRLALENERWTFYHPASGGVKGFQIPAVPPRFLVETIAHRTNADGTIGELVRAGLERPHVPNERLLSGRRLKPFARSLLELQPEPQEEGS